MSADNTTPMTINTLSSSAFKNMYMIAEIIVFSITTFYFYRKINSLTYQLKEMDTKIQQLEKTITEQKTFINDKMTEMSSIVSNMLRQSRPPVYTQPQPPPQTYTAQSNSQPVQQTAQTVYSPFQPTPQTVYTHSQTSQTNVQTAQQQYVHQPPRPNTQVSTHQTVQSSPVSNVQNVQYTQQLPETTPTQYAPPPQVQQQTVYTPPSPQSPHTPSTPPIVFPFELIVVGNTDNSNNSNSKMTIEEDDDDLDKELSAELSELNDK